MGCKALVLHHLECSMFSRSTSCATPVDLLAVSMETDACLFICVFVHIYFDLAPDSCRYVKELLGLSVAI